jgi:hypothetical protein
MDPIAIVLPPRYDGAERRRAFGEHPGPERRMIDPATEQDHPELFYPQPDDLQQPPSA